MLLYFMQKYIEVKKKIDFFSFCLYLLDNKQRITRQI